MGNTCPSAAGSDSGSNYPGPSNKDSKTYARLPGESHGQKPKQEGYLFSKPLPNLKETLGKTGMLKSHQMDELLRRVQDHHLDLIKEDIKNDLNAFILDNLLLCIQLFDNFDKAAVEAREFKHEIEKQIAEKLAPLANDGAIHGERRCLLLHGMGQQLAQNYFYKDKVGKKIKLKDGSSEYDLNESSSSDDETEIPEEKRTFLCEGILPLEFTVTWDNLEIYKENEWDDQKEYEYTAAKGMASIARFCLEEPNDDNKIPKGYVRLRCVDVPASVRLGHDPVTGKPIPPTPDEVYYSRASDFTADKISEVGSDSDLHSTDDNLDRDYGRKSRGRWNAIPNSLSKANKLKPNGHAKQNGGGSGKANQLVIPRRKPVAQVLEGNSNWQLRPNKSLGGFSKSETYLPDVVVSPGTESGGSSLSNRSPIPPPTPSRVRTPSKPTVLTKQFSKSVPKLTSKGAPKAGEYVGIRTRSNSVASEDVRQKWRQFEVKHLGQFPILNRQHKTNEPIHQSCFTPFKVEIESEDEDQNKNDSSEDSTSEESSSSEDLSPNARKTRFTLNSKKKKGRGSDSDDDSKFEKRFYLDSSAVSADFCSEFHKVGKQIGVPENSLSEAIVLGTTIRCSIPHPKGLGLSRKNIAKRPKHPYKILYTFTPSLQSKSWPQRPASQITWAQKARSKRESEILRWPQMQQVESVEVAGCNIIPLGSRHVHSTQSDQVKQPFNWQVGFANPETILLNTFKNVHWRCYVTTALLFRAFIAPLGPLGFGLEHIRNMIYEMCNKDFYNWTEEKPGSQLIYLLNQLYDCLSVSQMSNFFVEDYNMLRNIPSQNTKKVQASLKPVVFNTIIHCIYAFRNLKPMKAEFYPLPDFQQLYKILTAKEQSDLINVGIELHGLQQRQKEDKVDYRRLRSHKKKKRQQGNGLQDHLLKEGESVPVEGLFTQHVLREDKVAKNLRKKWEKYTEQQRKIQREEREKERIEKAKNALPQERRSSIDLSRIPEKKMSTSHLRLPLMLRFFIPHFILMARQSFNFRAYAQTAMYILHVENLCKILGEQTNDGDLAEEYLRETETLRQAMGPEKMREYIRSKFPHLDEGAEILDEVSMLNLTSRPLSNWVLADNRNLPPVPAVPEKPPSVRRIPPPSRSMAKSLHSIPLKPVAPEEEDANNNFDKDFEFEALGVHVKPILPRAKPKGDRTLPPPSPRRTKFVQKPYFSNKPSFIKGPFFTRATPGLGPTEPPILFPKNLPSVPSYLNENQRPRQIRKFN